MVKQLFLGVWLCLLYDKELKCETPASWFVFMSSEYSWCGNPIDNKKNCQSYAAIKTLMLCRLVQALTLL